MNLVIGWKNRNFFKEIVHFIFMRYEFEETSGLHGLVVEDPDKIGHVFQDERGNRKYIFGFNRKIPQEVIESIFMARERMSIGEQSPDVVSFSYEYEPGAGIEILLLTMEAYYAFISEHLEINHQVIIMDIKGEIK